MKPKQLYFSSGGVPLAPEAHKTQAGRCTLQLELWRLEEAERRPFKTHYICQHSIWELRPRSVYPDKEQKKATGRRSATSISSCEPKTRSEKFKANWKS